MYGDCTDNEKGFQVIGLMPNKSILTNSSYYILNPSYSATGEFQMG